MDGIVKCFVCCFQCEFLCCLLSVLFCQLLLFGSNRLRMMVMMVYRVMFFRLMLLGLVLLLISMLLMLNIRVIEMIIRLCVFERLILCWIRVFMLIEVMVLNSRQRMLFIIGIGMFCRIVLNLLMKVRVMVIIVVQVMIFGLQFLVSIIVLVIFVQVVLGGLLNRLVVEVVRLLLRRVWCRLGFFRQFWLVMLFIVMILLICLMVGVRVIGMMNRIVCQLNFGVVNFGSFSQGVVMIVVVLIMLKMNDRVKLISMLVMIGIRWKIFLLNIVIIRVVSSVGIEIIIVVWYGSNLLLLLVLFIVMFVVIGVIVRLIEMIIGLIIIGGSSLLMKLVFLIFIVRFMKVQMKLVVIILFMVVVRLNWFLVRMIGVMKVKLEVRNIGIWCLVINWNSRVLRLVVNSVMLGFRLVISGISISVLKVMNSICVFDSIWCQSGFWKVLFMFRFFFVWY